jgi:hypothetical protein
MDHVITVSGHGVDDPLCRSKILSSLVYHLSLLTHVGCPHPEGVGN